MPTAHLAERPRRARSHHPLIDLARRAHVRALTAERGQGTVEYVALLLLVAAVLAAAVTAVNGKSFSLEKTITDQLTHAIKKVTDASG